ncbi:hypothetical protein HNR19_000584 [Nocardioides thalensis]|uniref:Uncharacterized protein n=1 Tax=Nocardioides thalensis TaxID=1914755 RepID=A0A853BYR4_9ACTN|nr:hypothetical protein [Nocardioides thalensis]NYI99885.1 hypothetical protein [Nocardioides thalensis]
MSIAVLVPSDLTAVPAAVVELRPRVVARRVAALRQHLVERRDAEPQHARLLDIIREVLDRWEDVADADLHVWERYLGLLEEHAQAPHATAACAATANLVGLGLFAAPRDYLALADLAEMLGHERLARIQHRYGVPLESHPGLQLTTEALRSMLAEGLHERLARHPLTLGRLEAIDNACLRAAHALLLQGIDRDWSVPVLDSIDELVDIAENGTIVEWRHHMAMVTASAWAPYTGRLVEIAAESGHPHAAAVIAAIIDLCRDQSATEGDPVAHDMAPLAALSGAPDTEVARWAGADAPRPAYRRKWAPSRRMRRASEQAAAMVAERRAQREAAARRKNLRSIPGGRSRRAAV